MLYVRSNTSVLKRHSRKPYFSPIATKNIILRSRACEQWWLERGECKRGRADPAAAAAPLSPNSPSLPPHPTNSAATARKLMVFSLHLGVVSCHQVPKTLPLNATMAASERRSVGGGLVLHVCGRAPEPTRPRTRTNNSGTPHLVSSWYCCLEYRGARAAARSKAFRWYCCLRNLVQGPCAPAKRLAAPKSVGS